MNEKYLDLMEKTLSAYTYQHIVRYFNDVKTDGLVEHGFPRLTANIGILISYGRRLDLLPTFLEMMEFCCENIPVVKAANDFSVREIVSCIQELEARKATTEENIQRWKGYLSTINPKTCYNRFAETPTDPVRNWALFTGLSEYFRRGMGLCDSSEFIDTQIASQLQWFDENGMYMDNYTEEARQPIMYDLVPRCLFALLLYAGYRGKYYEKIDEILKNAGLLTLKMQSVNGEAAFGGRSNQFLHNEAWLANIFEYEAARYQKEKNFALAGEFKAAANKALKFAEHWLFKIPITHIKNRFPIDSKYGCETYAYFDKYMISAASCFYVAGLFCDDTIQPTECDGGAMVWSSSKYFHKTFAKAGDYAVEFDTNGDPRYDASGLGRVHRREAPSAICLSVPIARHAVYGLGGRKNASAFSICPAVKDENEKWIYGAEEEIVWALRESKAEKDECRLRFDCDFEGNGKVAFTCDVHGDGVIVKAIKNAKKDIGICLPIFSFDGENQTTIIKQDGKLLVEYDGWVCEYKAANIKDLQTEYANRNGLYKGYMAIGKESVTVQIKIYQN